MSFHLVDNLMNSRHDCGIDNLLAQTPICRAHPLGTVHNLAIPTEEYGFFTIPDDRPRLVCVGCWNAAKNAPVGSPAFKFYKKFRNLPQARFPSNYNYKRGAAAAAATSAVATKRMRVADAAVAASSATAAEAAAIAAAAVPRRVGGAPRLGGARVFQKPLPTDVFANPHASGFVTFEIVGSGVSTPVPCATVAGVGMLANPLRAHGGAVQDAAAVEAARELGVLPLARRPVQPKAAADVDAERIAGRLQRLVALRLCCDDDGNLYWELHGKGAAIPAIAAAVTAGGDRHVLAFVRSSHDDDADAASSCAAQMSLLAAVLGRVAPQKNVRVLVEKASALRVPLADRLVGKEEDFSVLLTADPARLARENADLPELAALHAAAAARGAAIFALANWCAVDDIMTSTGGLSGASVLASTASATSGFSAHNHRMLVDVELLHALTNNVPLSPLAQVVLQIDQAAVRRGIELARQCHGVTEVLVAVVGRSSPSAGRSSAVQCAAIFERVGAAVDERDTRVQLLAFDRAVGQSVSGDDDESAAFVRVRREADRSETRAVLAVVATADRLTRGADELEGLARHGRVIILVLNADRELFRRLCDAAAEAETALLDFVLPGIQFHDQVHDLFGRYAAQLVSDQFGSATMVPLPLLVCSDSPALNVVCTYVADVSATYAAAAKFSPASNLLAVTPNLDLPRAGLFEDIVQQAVQRARDDLDARFNVISIQVEIPRPHHDALDDKEHAELCRNGLCRDPTACGDVRVHLCQFADWRCSIFRPHRCSDCVAAARDGRPATAAAAVAAVAAVAAAPPPVSAASASAAVAVAASLSAAAALPVAAAAALSLETWPAAGPRVTKLDKHNMVTNARNHMTEFYDKARFNAQVWPHGVPTYQNMCDVADVAAPWWGFSGSTPVELLSKDLPEGDTGRQSLVCRCGRPISRITSTQQSRSETKVLTDSHGNCGKGGMNSRRSPWALVLVNWPLILRLLPPK